MSPLSFVLIVSSIFVLFFAIDGLQKKRFNILHFLILIVGIGIVLAFIFIPGFEGVFARRFGVARGSDVIVYGTLMILGYFYFELLHEVVNQKVQSTRIVSADAIRGAGVITKIYDDHANEKNNFVFLLRAYNEGEVIGGVIDSIFAAGFSKIVVVNDGSQDNTIDVVQSKIEQYVDKYLYLISHVVNRGAGSANKTGFQFLQQNSDKLHVERFVTYDADGQMDIKDMDTFISEIKKHPQSKVFLGTRFLRGGSATNIPASRKVILWGSKIVTRVLNKLNVSDPHNGYRVIHTSILSKIQISSDGMAYASELLDSIRIHDIPFVEVPVHILYSDYSLAKGQQNRNAVKILVELIYKKIFFK